MFMQKVVPVVSLLLLLEYLLDVVAIAGSKRHNQSFPPYQQAVEFEGIGLGKPSLGLIESARIPDGLDRAAEIVGAWLQPRILSGLVRGPVRLAEVDKSIPEVSLSGQISRKYLQQAHH